MSVPGQVKTSKNKSSTKKTMGEGATEASKVGMSMLIPVVGLKAVSAAIAAKGATAAVKKFGPNLVKAAKKYFDPVKTQKMKTGRGRGTSGNKKEMEDAFVVYKKGPLSKTKKGDTDMGMKKVTKVEGEKMLAKGAARKVGLGTVAAATGIAVGSSLSKDKKEPKGTPATVTPNQKSRQATLPKDEGMGGKATVSPNQKSRQATLAKPPKPKKKPTITDVGQEVSKKKDKPKKVLDKEAMSAKTKDGPSSSKRRAGEPVPKRKAKPSIIDKSAGGSKKDISDPKKAKGYDYSPNEDDYKFEADDLNLYKGGMAFGKGGMYKGNKKAYGMRYGGFTRRGMGK